MWTTFDQYAAGQPVTEANTQFSRAGSAFDWNPWVLQQMGLQEGTDYAVGNDGRLVVLGPGQAKLAGSQIVAGQGNTFGAMGPDGTVDPATMYQGQDDNAFWNAALLAGAGVAGGVGTWANMGNAAAGGNALAGGASGAYTSPEISGLATQTGLGGGTGTALGGSGISASYGAMPAGGTSLTGASGLTGAAPAAAGSWIPGISNGTALNIGANLLQGYLGSNAAGKAADAQLQAGQQSNALLREMWQANQAENKPLLDMRNALLPQLQGLVTNPSSITSDPGYQFGLSEGNKMIADRAAASGNYYSGGQLKAAQRYGQDYAGTKLDQSINRLMGVAGLGQVGSNANQANNTGFANASSNVLQGMGNVRGSAYQGQANSWGNAIGNAYNSYQQEQLLRQLMGGGG